VPALDDELNAEQRIIELERTAARLQRQLSDAKTKTSALIEAVREAAHEAQIVVGRPKAIAAPKTKAGKGDPEWGLLHLSDWQLGKRTDEYDTDICVKRVRHVIDRVRRITEIQRKDHPVPGIAVMFGGDHVEGGGGIFPGQPYEVDSTGYAQLMTAANLMAEVVLTLLQDFESVKVYSVHGNHGRLGRRGDLPREDNLDTIAFAIARTQLSNQARVDWTENLHWYDEVRIGKYAAMLCHGDQIRGFGGTPAFAIARKVTAWSSGAIPFDFQDCYLGHYHQNLVITLPNGGQVRMVPSTESGSQYASEFMASRGRPGQRLLMVHPEHGRVTGEWMIWLDE
jgi:hypothetical protein